MTPILIFSYASCNKCFSKVCYFFISLSVGISKWGSRRESRVSVVAWSTPEEA